MDGIRPRDATHTTVRAGREGLWGAVGVGTVNESCHQWDAPIEMINGMANGIIKCKACGLGSFLGRVGMRGGYRGDVGRGGRAVWPCCEVVWAWPDGPISGFALWTLDLDAIARCGIR